MNNYIKIKKMKKLLFIALLIAFKINANATIVYASSFGWNATDATSAFQAAINSSADTIIIDMQVSDWIVGPNVFSDIHNKTIIFQPGVVLQAKPGAFISTSDCLLDLRRASNIKIIGYGAIFQMHKAEYAALADGGEWRASISLTACDTIEVYGLKLNESGGDGVYITGRPYCENVKLKDLWCDNQYRQGISVISAKHLLVQNCWFTNTSGTLPECGLDIETNDSANSIIDVVFENCRFTGNHGSGIALGFANSNDSTAPVDMTFRDCYLSGNHDISNAYVACEINIGASVKNAVKGTAKFERCLVENSQWTVVSMRKPADSYLVSFDDCVFLNVSQHKGLTYNSPIWIEVTDYYNPCPRFGGIAFNNCLISYTNNYTILGSYGDIATSPGMGNVHLNNLTVFSPISNININVTAGGGAPDTSCKFIFKKYLKAPETNVYLSSDHNMTDSIGGKFNVQALRTSCNLTFPIGVTYNVSGTATQGIDMNLMNGFLIIPKNLHSHYDTAHFIKELSYTAKDFQLTIDSSSVITISPSLLDTTIALNCGATEVQTLTNENKFTTYPNPASGFIKIKFNDNYEGPIQVINETGQIVLSQKAHSEENLINMNGFAKGMYFIRIQLGERCYQQKIINL
jgi:hypothetical protein